MPESITGTPEPSNARPLSHGEKAVGITFNPSNNVKVETIKRLSAQLLDAIFDQRAGLPNEERHPETWDMYMEAVRRIQEGQMWAVKAATWQY